MDNKIKNKIIKEHLKGKGSTTIEKEIGIPKRTILKILNDEGIVRKRDRCHSLDITKDGEKYYVTRKCPKCDKDVSVRSHSSI
jgi:hypothetical protein